MARPRKNVVKDQNSLLTSDNVVEIPVEEQPYPLPEGWKWVRLGEISNIVTGSTPSKKHPEYYGGNFPFFKPSDLDAGRHVVSSSEFLTDEGKKKCRIIPSGSIGVCCIGTIGKSGYFDIDCTTNQQINSVIPKCNGLYVYYYTKTLCFLYTIKKKVSATTISIVNKSKLETCTFPLPPIDEQQRIVDRIESLFAKLDEAREKAEAVLDGFESRKAAILHKAFTGELTAKWREKNGLKKENKAIKIKDILLDIKYGTSEKSDYTYTGLPVIRIPNIIDNTIDLDDLKFLKSNDSSNYDLVEKNDILMIRSNGSRELVGKCALVDETIVGKAYASFLIRLRPKKSVNAKYLLNFMSSSLARNQLFSKTKSSAGINNINSKEICSVDIWLPTTEEQQEIVRTLDTFLEKERQVKEAAEDVLERIDLMKKAILAKAFRGELTR